MIELDRWAVDRAFRLQQEVVEAYRDYQFHLIYQKVQQFCVVDMGSFYLDVIKDRQYTTQADSLPRRSCQTAMYHIAEAMSRWLAPILSFTAEEIWQHLPGQRAETVFVESWYEGLFPLEDGDPMDRAFWDQVIAARLAVGPALETARKAGLIGSSLDAELDLYCAEPLGAVLACLESELRFALITSEVRLHSSSARPSDALDTEMKGLAVRVTPSPHTKCVRCWHHRPDVGADSEHPELCGRCVENVAGSGETRRYA
jgi:isoleucyl-tRNA synthetase